MTNVLLRDFTKPEIEYLLEQCNFTDDERTYFLLRTRDKSNIQIAMEMNISEAQVSRLAKRVKTKICKIL